MIDTKRPRKGAGVPLRNMRYEVFCQKYVGTCLENAAGAFLAAGFCAASADDAASNASRLMKRPDVIARIKFLRDENYEIARMDRLEAVTLLSDIARAKIQDFLQPDGTIKTHGVPYERALREVDVMESGTGDARRRTIKIKLHDPIAAIINLAKITGMCEPEKSNDAGNGLHELLAEIDGVSHGGPVP